MQSRFRGWSAQVLDANDVTAVMREMDRYGFAIVRDQWRFDASDFKQMSARYGLGPMYQSDFNRRLHTEGMSASGMNQVGGLTAGVHDVFNSQSSTALHTDGSYLPIGTIKTSILLCKQHALRGGESILFDSVSAFQTLAHHHPDLAKCLLSPKAFRRRSTDPRLDRQYTHVGPIFLAEEDGAMVGGFTLDVTADWDYCRRTDPRVLDATAYLTDLAKPGSGYIVSFTLQKGHALIMRNDQLSHGRNAYVDDPGNPRILLRGLFRCAPGAGAVQIPSPALGSKASDSRTRTNG